MNRFAIISATIAALALVSFPAHAKKEIDTKRTVWELSDFPELETKAKAVCGNDKLVKSDRLKRACSENQFPRVTKAGLFYNTGYGAEFNALMRQGN